MSFCSFVRLSPTHTDSGGGLSRRLVKPPIATGIHATGLFICSSVCRQNTKTRFSQKTKQFTAMVSIDDLYEVVHRLFKKPIIGPLKSKMAEIRHLENRFDVIFSAKGGPIWIKFRRLVQNDMSTAVIWPKSKPEVEFQYGGRLGEFNGMSSSVPSPEYYQTCEHNVLKTNGLKLTLIGTRGTQRTGMKRPTLEVGSQRSQEAKLVTRSLSARYLKQGLF